MTAVTICSDLFWQVEVSFKLNGLSVLVVLITPFVMQWVNENGTHWQVKKTKDNRK